MRVRKEKKAEKLEKRNRQKNKDCIIVVVKGDARETWETWALGISVRARQGTQLCNLGFQAYTKV